MFATALAETFRRGYSLRSLRSDILAGLTVGVLALPLSMALALASGVPPQHGLYTAIIAGAIIAICGGSRVNISGPTAAFVVVLLPVVHQFGLGGLVMAGLLAGLILVALGLARMGRLIEYVPYPVTVGFTAGIAIVIAMLQIKDFLGLDVAVSGDHFFDRVSGIVSALPTLHWQDTFIATLTLAILIVWPRLGTRVPGLLVALTAATLVGWICGHFIPGFDIATVGSVFSYTLDGVIKAGIPPLAPQFVWPWELPGADGQPIGLSFQLINDLLGPALTIAALAAIESLLCAVIADGMAGTRHDPNAELIGLGLGNILVPFFAGIPATAAITRTAASVRAGAVSPIAAVIHAMVVLLAVLALAGLLGYVPMAALAALMMMVAWNMSEAKHVLRIMRAAPGSDVAVLVSCLVLTVVFDMTVAVAIGIGLAALLFIRQVSEQTEAKVVSHADGSHAYQVPAEVLIYDVNGALFFGAAHRAMRSLEALPPGKKVVIMDMTDVSILDMTAIMLLQELLTSLEHRGTAVIISGLHPRLILQLQRVGVVGRQGRLEFTRDVAGGIVRATVLCAGPGEQGGDKPSTA